MFLKNIFGVLDGPLLTFMLYYRIVYFLVSCIFAMSTTNIARDAEFASVSPKTLDGEATPVATFAKAANDVSEKSPVKREEARNDSISVCSPKTSPRLAARQKLSSSISAIKRGASALSSSVSDLTRASKNEKLANASSKPSGAAEPGVKRPSLPDFPTKLTKRLNFQFKAAKSTFSRSFESPTQSAKAKHDKTPGAKKTRDSLQSSASPASQQPRRVSSKGPSAVAIEKTGTFLKVSRQSVKVPYRTTSKSTKSTTNAGGSSTPENDSVRRKDVVSLPSDFSYGQPASPQRRVTPGRSANRDVKSDTELYGSVHLKAVLNVLRSNVSAEEKLLAIKKSKDYWDKIGTVTEEVPCLWDSPTTMSSGNNNEGKPIAPPIVIQSSSCDVEDEVSNGKPHVTKITLSPDTSETEQCISSIVQQVSLEVNPGVLVDGLDDNDSNRPVNFKTPKNSLILNVDANDLALSQCSQPPKSPVTVQDWVNSIDLNGEQRNELLRTRKTDFRSAVVLESDCVQPPERSSVSHDSGYHSHGDPLAGSFVEDNLNLGAEARNIDGVVDSSIPEIPSPSQRKESLSPGGHHVSLTDFRLKQSSFNSETSTFSTVSSLSSVESLLEARREDPEEILLALGFGSAAQDPLARIPQRFLSQPSSARGVDLVTFLRKQEEEFQKQECSCLGYRGLAAMSPSDNKQPSAIATKIIEKLGEKSRSVVAGATPVGTGSISSSNMSPVTPKPRSFASAVLAATAFKHGKVLKRSDSILDPANREFLLKQGADNSSLKHKKVILGSHTFKFDPEGDLVQTSPENSAPPSSPSSPPNEAESTQARNQRLKEVFKRLHLERSLREQEDNAKKLHRSKSSMAEKSSVSLADSKMHLSLQEPSENDRKNRPALVRQLKIEDCVSDDGKTTNLNVNCLFPDSDKGKLENKESFELEEITAEQSGSPSFFQSPLTVEGSLSESSGFEDGHLCSPPGKHDFASMEENVTIETRIPPVEVTTCEVDDASSPPPSPNFSQRSRYSDPMISLNNLRPPSDHWSSSNSNQLSPSSTMSRNSSSGTITDGNHSSNSSVSQFEKMTRRKGSYPQPTPRKWVPVTGEAASDTLERHFQWNKTDPLSKRLSSSQTTLINCDAARRDIFDYAGNSSAVTLDKKASRNKSANDVSCQVSFEDLSASESYYLKQRRATWCTVSSRSPRTVLSRNTNFTKEDVLAKNQALVELKHMKLALEQYRLQSQQLESSSLRFLRLYPFLSPDQISSLESVHRLRLEIFREIGRMEELLSQQISLVKANSPSDYDVLNFRFSRAIDQMSVLLREQASLCQRLDEVASFSDREKPAGNVTSDQTTMDYVTNELSLLRQQVQLDQQSQRLKFQQLIEEAKNEILEGVTQFIRNRGNLEATESDL